MIILFSHKIRIKYFNMPYKKIKQCTIELINKGLQNKGLRTKSLQNKASQNKCLQNKNIKNKNIQKQNQTDPTVGNIAG